MDRSPPSSLPLDSSEHWSIRRAIYKYLDNRLVPVHECSNYISVFRPYSVIMIWAHIRADNDIYAEAQVFSRATGTALPKHKCFKCWNLADPGSFQSICEFVMSKDNI